MTARTEARATAYGNRVSRSRWIALVVYTLLRLGLFAAVWVLVQVVTPWRGLVGVAVAILISGGISLFVLDRPRGQLAIGVQAFMQRINDRIEASTRAEDDDDPLAGGEHGEDHGQPGSVDEDDRPGILEDGDQPAASGTVAHHADGPNGREQSQQAEQQPPVG